MRRLLRIIFGYAATASAPFYHANRDCAICRLRLDGASGRTPARRRAKHRRTAGNICRPRACVAARRSRVRAGRRTRWLPPKCVRRRGAGRGKSALPFASIRLRHAEMPALDGEIRAGCAQMSCAGRYWRWMCNGTSGRGWISLRTSMREANDGCCIEQREVRAMPQPTTYVLLQELCQAIRALWRRMNAAGKPHGQRCAM